MTIIYEEEGKEGSYTQIGLNPRSSKGLTGFNFLSFNQFKGKGMSEKTCPWVQLLGLLLQKFPDYLCHRPCKLYSMDLTLLWSVDQPELIFQITQVMHKLQILLWSSLVIDLKKIYDNGKPVGGMKP